MATVATPDRSAPAPTPTPAPVPAPAAGPAPVPASSASSSKRLEPSDLVDLDVVRSRLATVWLSGAGAVVIIVVLQSLLQRFGNATQDAWGWLLPTIMPTLLMIITVLGYTALDPMSSTSVVRKSFFHIATAVSVAYLVLVALTVLIGPFVANTGREMIELMQTSNLWLGPFQGLVASLLGVLFVTKQQKQPRAEGDT